MTVSSQSTKRSPRGRGIARRVAVCAEQMGSGWATGGRALQWGAFLAASLLAVSAGGSEVIYNTLQDDLVVWLLTDAGLNETNSTVEFGGENEAQVGQLVTFAGTSRFVTSFEAVVYFPGNSPPSRRFGVTLTLYEENAGQPGQVIWSGQTVVTTLSPSAHAVSCSFTPNVLVPDSLVFAFRYDLIAGQNQIMSPGVMLSQVPPVIGTASPRPLIQDSSTLLWYPDPWGGPNQYFLRARITAEAAPVCYGNCDGSTTPPLLNIADFTCFLQRFAAGDLYANCDESTVAPVLNVGDFTCFLQQFAAGCP
jgi:hypothetical protein